MSYITKSWDQKVQYKKKNKNDLSLALSSVRVIISCRTVTAPGTNSIFITDTGLTNQIS